MKKQSVLLFVAMFFLLSTQVNAASTRTVLSPTLTFDGTTAKCSIFVVGYASNDVVSATLKLWHGNTFIETWEDEATTFLSMSKTATVTKGETYKLTVDISINGVPQATVPVTRTCN